MSSFGRRFYGFPADEAGEKVCLRKTEGKVVEEVYTFEEESVVPFWSGKKISWEIV